ncbi:transporter substrate-binding domain-containing protein, partial [Photobacterium damselae]
DVALGRTDAFVMDRLSSLEVIKKVNRPLQLAAQTFEQIENAWPFSRTEKGKKLQQEVNQALANMRKDGTLRQLSEKWFASDITQ